MFDNETRDGRREKQNRERDTKPTKPQEEKDKKTKREPDLINQRARFPAAAAGLAQLVGRASPLHHHCFTDGSGPVRQMSTRRVGDIICVASR